MSTDAAERTLDWRDIDGWLSEGEGRVLAALAAGADVLEFGSYRGRSTVCLAQTARKVVSVDTHEGDGDTGPSDTWNEFSANLEAAGVWAAVRAFVGRVEVEFAAAANYDSAFGLVFVDASHDAESVERHTRIALRCVRPGGTIAWHDWDRESVRQGVRAAGCEPTATRESLAWQKV